MHRGGGRSGGDRGGGRGRGRGGHRGGGWRGGRDGDGGKRGRRDDGGDRERSKPEIVDASGAADAPPAPLPVTEMVHDEAVGITHYLTKSPPLGGILKQRFTDFLVNEISMTGDVVHLKSVLTPPKPAPAPKVSTELEWGDYLAGSGKWQAMMDMHALVGQSGWAAISSLLMPAADGSVSPGFVILPALTDKEARKRIHELVREHFPMLNSDFVNRPEAEGGNGIRIFLKGAKGVKGSRFDDRRGEAPWPKDRPEYVQFVLAKQNLDTISAIAELSRRLRLPQDKFAFAGTKDKRGVTCQLVTVHKVPIERLATVNHASNIFFVGDACYVPQPLSLGALRGNRFQLVIRNVNLAGEGDGGLYGDLGAMLREWSSVGYGFVNYFGLQRFGNAHAPTHSIGKALLKHNWEEAVNLILGFKPGEPETVRQAKACFFDTKDPVAALKLMPIYMHVEICILRGLARHGPTQFRLALLALPRPTRLLYLHAYQSFLWNRVASKRLSELGDRQPVVGDLVMYDASDMANLATGDVEVEDGPDPVAEAASRPAATDETDADIMDVPVEAIGASSGLLPRIRVLSAADIASGKFTMFDVVLPVPGYSTVFPEHSCGKALYDELLAVDELVAPDVWQQRSHRDLSLSGTYRPLLNRALDVEWDVIPYTDPTAQLTKTDLDGVIAPSGPPAPAQAATGDASYHALRIGFSLGKSSYATMLLRELLKVSTSSRYQKRLNAAAPGAIGDTSGTSEQQEQADDVIVEDSAPAKKAKAGLSDIDRTVDGKGFAFTKLSLRDKGLTDLGSSLAGFIHVRYLDVSKNKLTEVKGMSGMSSLLSVLLDENDLTSLPSLAASPYMQVVVANNNVIESLKGVSSESVIQLSVNANALTSLAGFGPCPALRRLEATMNAITSLDAGRVFPILQELLMSANALTSLKGLDTCYPAAKLAMFNDNKLTDFEGVEWFRLSKLAVLYCERTAIESPAALSPLVKCASLRRLFLTGSPIADSDNYRQEVLLLLPQLTQLDGVAFTKDDRIAAEEEGVRRREEAEAKLKEEQESKEAGGEKE